MPPLVTAHTFQRLSEAAPGVVVRSVQVHVVPGCAQLHGRVHYQTLRPTQPEVRVDERDAQRPGGGAGGRHQCSEV